MDETAANPMANKANWTIKDFPATVRKEAVNCAKRQDVSVATWLAAAVRNQASHDEGAAVLLPDEQANLPANPADQAPTLPADPFQRLSALAAAGLPVPRDVRGHAFAILRDEMRALRGLPPRRRRRLAVRANPGQPSIAGPDED